MGRAACKRAKKKPACKACKVKRADLKRFRCMPGTHCLNPAPCPKYGYVRTPGRYGGKCSKFIGSQIGPELPKGYTYEQVDLEHGPDFPDGMGSVEYAELIRQKRALPPGPNNGGWVPINGNTHVPRWMTTDGGQINTSPVPHNIPPWTHPPMASPPAAHPQDHQYQSAMHSAAGGRMMGNWGRNYARW